MFYTANHFSGREQVVMGWHLLGNGVAALDVAAAGALDFATIRVTCDGPSDLGDHVIIARTNQVCHVPLLAGATYAVESDLPIAYSAVSSEHAHIVTNSTTNLTVSLPLEFTVERIQMRDGSGASNYGVRSMPINVYPDVSAVTGGCCTVTGGEACFSWSCSESLRGQSIRGMRILR